MRSWSGSPSVMVAVLVLCYLEGLTHEEAARQLGCPVGTVRSRLARGRTCCARLERRGIAPAASTLHLGPRSGHRAGPAPLFATTIQAAVRLAAGQPLAGVVPVGVERLVAGVLRTMALTKFTILALGSGFGRHSDRPDDVRRSPGWSSPAGRASRT